MMAIGILGIVAKIMVFAGGGMLAVSVLSLLVSIFMKDARGELKGISKQAFICGLLLLLLGWLIG